MASAVWKVEVDFDSTVAANMYKDAVAISMPAVWHRFQEPSGTTVIDSSGNGLTATLSGSTLNQTGPVTGETADKAVLFAQTATLGRAAFTGPTLSADVISIECFFKLTDFVGATDFFLFNNDNAGSSGFVWVTATSVGAIRVRTGAGFASIDQSTSGGLLSAGVWAHCVVILDGGTNAIEIWLNGVRWLNYAGATGGMVVSQMAKTFKWGGNTSLVPADFIDEGAIYDYKLSETDILDHYNARAVTPPAAANWTDVTDYVVGDFEFSRGRGDGTGRVEPSRATVVLRDKDRRFEPGYAGEVYNETLNPSAEVNTTGWSGFNGTLTRVADGTTDAGANVFNLASTAAGGGLVLDAGSVYQTAVTAGQIVYLRVRVKYVSGTAPTKIYLAARTYDAPGGTLVAQTEITNQTSPVLGTWYTLSARYTIPGSGVGAVSVQVGNTGGAIGTNWRYDAVQLKLVSSTEADPVYVDGTTAGAHWEGTAHLSRSMLGAPYYPNVLPRKKLRISATYSAVTYNKFTGYIEAWEHDAAEGLFSENVRVTAVDGFGVLAEADLGARFFRGARIDARVSRILTIGAWKDGTSIGAAVNFCDDETVQGGNPAEYLLSMGQADWGLFFIDGDGDAVFQGATHRGTATRSTVSQGTFVDVDEGGTTIPYDSCTRESGVKFVVNEVTIQRPGGLPQTAADKTSQRQYGRQSYSETFAYTVDSTCLQRASDLVALYKDARQRITSVSVNCDAYPTRTFAKLLGAELSDRYIVKRTPNGVGSPIDGSGGHVVWLESERWTVSRLNTRVTLGFSPVHG